MTVNSSVAETQEEEVTYDYITNGVRKYIPDLQTEDGRPGTGRQMEGNRSCDQSSSSELATEPNLAYNYRQPTATPNIAYEHSQSYDYVNNDFCTLTKIEV